jgi:phage tail sheath protein FI
MAAYTAPGVYCERVDSGAPRMGPLRTDIAGFVGIARQGPVHTALPVDSWRQFQAWFGDLTGAGYLAYATRAYFDGGGQRVWVVRIASPAVAAASIDLGTATVPRAWRIAASSPGVWGNDLDVRVITTHRAQTRAQPAESTPEYTTVDSITGFSRASHVRLPIGPGTILYRIVAFVDPEAKRLYWIHPDPGQRRAWEQPLVGIDPNMPAVIESIEYTVLVYADGRLAARHEDLTLVPEHARYGPAIVPGLPRAPADERDWTVPLAPPLIAVEDLRDEAAIAEAEPLAAFQDRAALTGGADGLVALTVRDFIGEPTSPLDPDAIVRDRVRGLRALERVREVAVVAVPDIHIQPVPPPEYRPLPPCIPDPCLPSPPSAAAPPRPRAIGDLPPRLGEEEVYRVEAAMIEHCESLHDRVAILDPPYDAARDQRLGLSAIRAWRRRFDSSFGALYFQWVLVSDPIGLRGAFTRAIPPSGHVAGYIARSDLQEGVWKAPANGALSWIQDLTMPVDAEWHGVLNQDHVNAIRAFPGRGLRIFGARTLASDPDWRFLNVRRLLLMIEKALALACQWAVFEPNDAATRSQLHLSMTSFLLQLWQGGALAGRTPPEAFFVRCDEDTTPADARARGELVAEVGVAAVKPFEFVVVRVGRVDNQFEIAEAGPVTGMPS